MDKNTPYTTLTRKEICKDDSFVAADLLGIFISNYQPTQQGRSIVSFSILICLIGMLFFKWIMFEDIGAIEPFTGGKKCRKKGVRVNSKALKERCRYKMGPARRACMTQEQRRLDKCLHAGYKCDDGYTPSDECVRGNVST